MDLLHWWHFRGAQKHRHVVMNMWALWVVSFWGKSQGLPVAASCSWNPDQTSRCMSHLFWDVADVAIHSRPRNFWCRSYSTSNGFFFVFISISKFNLQRQMSSAGICHLVTAAVTVPTRRRSPGFPFCFSHGFTCFKSCFMLVVWRNPAHIFCKRRLCCAFFSACHAWRSGMAWSWCFSEDWEASCFCQSWWVEEESA